MLKLITNEVPAGLETYYTPTEGGQFRLQVEDAVPVAEVETLKQKNKEFRDNNIALMKENEKYKGFSTLVGTDTLTPDKFNEKIESLAESRVSSRVEEMRNKYELKLKELSDVASRSSSKLSELVLGSEVTKAAAEHGVISTALEDVVFRAKNAFVVNEGEIKFKEDKLDAEGKPYSVAKWMQEMKSKAPHLFAPSQGTGAARPVKGSVRPVGDNRSAVEKLSAGLSQLGGTSVKKLT